MNIQVTPHLITITQDDNINAGEYNITQCEFEFTDEYEDLTKQAVFSTCESTYKVPVLNNQCTIPSEVLENPGQVLLGVYGYEAEDDELVLRYSPNPEYFVVSNGSYKEGNDPDLPKPSEWEQVLAIINQAITETNNLNISVDKENGVTTVTLTKKDGTQKTVQIEDGKSLEFNWEGTSLGVRVEGQSEYQYVDLKGAKGDPGAIKMVIVNSLPDIGEEDTIYLVPTADPETGNNYDEYVFVNGHWEKLGGVQVQVDLTDYVKNTDYASAGKAGVVKANVGTGFDVNVNTGNPAPTLYNYSQYTNASNYVFIGKGTLENVITGKGLVSNTSYASASTGGVIKTPNGYALATDNSGNLYAVTKTYQQYTDATDIMFVGKGTLENVLNEKIGNIELILTALDIGSGAEELE